MANIFLTLFWNNDKQAGEPIKAYLKEEDAKMAVERSTAAKARFDELYKEKVAPYRCSYTCGSTQTERCQFPSKDGKFYDTPEGARYADKVAEFWDTEEVKECHNQNTREDYYEPVELVG